MESLGWRVESGESGLKWRGLGGEVMDGFDYELYVVVGDPGAGWEADAGFVEFFGDSVCVGRGVFVDRLEVHRFPEGRASMPALSSSRQRASVSRFCPKRIVVSQKLLSNPSSRAVPEPVGKPEVPEPVEG